MVGIQLKFPLLLSDNRAACPAVTQRGGLRSNEIEVMMTLSNMKVAVRLAVSFGSLTLFVLGIAVVAWRGITSVNQSMALARDEQRQTIEAKEVLDAARNIHLELWSIATATDAAAREQHKTDLQKVPRAI